MVMIKITIKIAKIIKLFVICYYLSCHGRVFSTKKKKLINKKIVSYLKRNSKTNYLLKTKTVKCSLTA